MRLAKQFPQLVSTIKKGNREEDYINHSVIAQRLLQVVGPYDWDFEIIYKGEEPIACKGTLTVDIDGKEVSIAGAGTPQNKSRDVGEQIKDPDAFKGSKKLVQVYTCELKTNTSYLLTYSMRWG